MNDKVLIAQSQMSAGWFDFLIVLGAMVVVALIVLLWALLVRKKEMPRHKHRHRRDSYRERFQKNAREIKQLIQPRQRKHGERHPLNPTLAEIGGLPPVREEEKSQGQPPAAPQP